jgi:hypothetical protein
MIDVAFKIFRPAWRNISRLLVSALVLSLVTGCSRGNSSRSQPRAVSKETPVSSADASYSVRISPEHATVRTTFSAIVEPALPGSKSVFVWFRDGNPVQTSESDKFVAKSARRGESVSVEADITDFHGNSFHAGSVPVTIENSPPRLTATPEILSAISGLTVTAQAMDDDGDPVILEYQWLENGRPMDGETSEQLNAKSFKAGNRYAVKVTPNDGAVRGQSLIVDAIRAEAVLNISLAPLPPRAGRAITAEINSPEFQPDSLLFEWLVNGTVVEEETGPTLGGTRFKKGDTITAKVYDPQPASSTKRILGTSNTVSVVNSPPIVEPVHASDLLEGGRYETTIVAKDPDGDPVSFALVQGPEGMTLDSNTGLLRWTPKGIRQPVHIVISTSDNEGLESRLSFDLLIGAPSAENRADAK